jgi:hypothetical protein
VLDERALAARSVREDTARLGELLRIKAVILSLLAGEKHII